MIISIGCDHIVTEIKDHVKQYLIDLGHSVIDVGTYDKIRTHYPIYGKLAAERVATKEADVGIIFCGTAIGITVAASKIKGVRAAVVKDVQTAKYAKKTLNANVIGMGGRVCGIGLIEHIIDEFLNAHYQETEENKKLIQQIDEMVKEDYSQDKGFFDEYLARWEQGDYKDES